MDAAANYAKHTTKPETLFSRRPRRCGCRFPLVSLLAAFGILAFIFSVIQPDDDDIQQEFCKTSTLKQFTFANYKAVSNHRTLRIRALCSALAPPTSQFPTHSATRFFVPCEEIRIGVSSSRTGDRSPPTASS